MAIPGKLVIYPEWDFYEMLKELLQDKQGQIRFETGNADFDALNATLGVQAVQIGGFHLKVPHPSISTHMSNLAGLQVRLIQW